MGFTVERGLGAILNTVIYFGVYEMRSIFE